jgi:hypothetical protein
MQLRALSLSVLALAVSATLGACGDDTTGAGPGDVATDADAGSGDAAEDVSPDVADVTDDTPDVAPEVTPDAADTATDGSADVDLGPCPGSILCIDERTGNPSLAVCTEAGYPAGTTCARVDAETACCVAPFRCETDSDCEGARAEEGFCGDLRYPCVCLDDGSCAIDICTADADCADAESCRDGLCVAAPDEATYVARILTPDGPAAPSSTLALAVIAVNPDDATDVLSDATFTFGVESGDATVSADGVVSFGTGAGAVVVRAQVAANTSDAGDTGTFEVLAPPAEGNLRVLVLDEASREPIEGALVAYRSASSLVSVATSAAGIVEFTDADVTELHVFADGYAYVSVFDAPDGSLVVSLPPSQRARIAEVRDGFVCDTSAPNTTLDDAECGEAGEPVCLCYELEAVDVVKGVADFTDVVGDGEVDLSLSGVALGNSLLDLNFDLIVGPSIERIIPDNPVIPLDDPVDIPSGVTIYFNNSPFVDSFIATAGPGERSVWSIGGRVPLGDTLLTLLPSLSGDLDFGAIVAAILPLFEDFYSGVTPPLEFRDGGTFPVRDPGLRLAVPTQRRVEIVPPALPVVASGWADTAILLGGALVPGQGFVPLGISGGTDIIGRGTPDGVIDGDHDTPEPDPLRMSIAPIHGAIAGTGTRYAMVSVALQLKEDVPGAPREASSGMLTLFPAGAPIPEVVEFERERFPALAEGTTWTAETRTVAIPDGGEASDIRRLVFRGEEDRLWVVYGAGDRTTFVLPSTEEGVAFEDRTARNRLNVVSVSLQEEAGVDYEGLLTAEGGTLLDLFTFIEAFSVIGL